MKLSEMKKAVLDYKELLFYLFWGVMTTFVSWGTYSFFIKVLSLGNKTVTSANILSWICAVLFAFITNKQWVFHSTDWALSVVFSELWKFIAARLATGLIEIVGVPLLVKIGFNQWIFGVEGMAAKIFVSVAVVILNYIFSRLLIFKKEKH